MSTDVTPSPLSRSAAERLTLDIRENGAKWLELVREAHDRKAWAALGYKSWSAYVDAELPFSRSTSYRLLSLGAGADVQATAGELSHGETINYENAEVRDVDNRPLDSITPDRVLPPRKAKFVGGNRRTGYVACSSEGTGELGTSPVRVANAGSDDLASAPSLPSDPSSGGAELQRPAPPTDEAAPKRSSSRSAPPDPNLLSSDVGELVDVPERPPSNRALTSRVVASMQAVDPTDAGPSLGAEEATFVRQWAQRTLDAWKAVYAPPAPAEKPQRRQGTITRPAAGRPKVVDLMEALEDSLAAAKRPAGKRHADDCSCFSCKAPKAAKG